ncbi:MAG: hypothetical protein Q4Q03_07285, partial [Bowdeniella nasicola]|nr:hypothetical protein [Bowdeniella nasicola]
MGAKSGRRRELPHPSLERAERNRFTARSFFARLRTSRRERTEAFNPQPAGVEDFTELNWRRLTAADSGALAILIAQAEAEENPPYRTTRNEVEDIFSPAYRLDCVGGFDERGALAAYGLVRITTEEPTVTIVTLSGTVHPDLRHRTIGGEVLRWQIGRAQDLIADMDPAVPAFAAIHIESGQDDMRDLVERHGFGVHDEVVQLRRQLSGPIPEREVPASICI